MNVWIGNITFDEVEEKLGYRLTEEDRKIWEKYHNPNADLSGMKDCFHVFEIPKAIVCSNKKTAIMIANMFTEDKLVCPRGIFTVYINRKEK